MSSFLGQHLHAIDDKGRVPLPARYRNGDAAAEFVLVRGPHGSLILFPRPAWGSVAERLSLLRRSSDPESRRRALAVTASAADLALDRHGRLSLPQHLIDVAALEREALFVGAGDVIEIWNPSRYEDYMKMDDLDYDRIALSVL